MSNWPTKRTPKPEQAQYTFIKPKIKSVIDSMNPKMVMRLVEAGEYELLFEILGIMCNQKRIHKIQHEGNCSDGLAPVWSEAQDQAVELAVKLIGC
jgi:hypothetical protein